MVGSVFVAPTLLSRNEGGPLPTLGSQPAVPARPLEVQPPPVPLTGTCAAKSPLTKSQKLLTTATVKLHWLMTTPFAMTAQVTPFVPIGNVEPLGGLHRM